MWSKCTYLLLLLKNFFTIFTFLAHCALNSYSSENQLSIHGYFFNPPNNVFINTGSTKVRRNCATWYWERSERKWNRYFLIRIYFSLLLYTEDYKTEGDIVPVVGSRKSSTSLLVVGDFQNVPNSDFCRTFRLRSPPTDEDDDWNWQSEQSEMIAHGNAKNSHLVRLYNFAFIYNR